MDDPEVKEVPVICPHQEQKKTAGKVIVGDPKIWTGDGGEPTVGSDGCAIFGKSGMIWKVGVVERDGGVSIVQVLFVPERFIDGVRPKV